MNITELKAKYPKTKARHDPLATCTRCDGTGETAGRMLPSGQTYMPPGACICTFVDHDVLPVANASLATAVSSLANIMVSEPSPKAPSKDGARANL
jgi:hypothetical protein